MSDEQNDRPVLIPGPDHPITIERNQAHVVVSVAGKAVADTRAALTLREASHPPVQYVPLQDVDTSLLVASDRETYCPYKGDCSYYTIEGAGEAGVDAVWEYRDPRPPVESIRGHVAFYADRVQVAEGD